MSPGLIPDVFQPTMLAGARHIRTDGFYAWPDSLAYYVERYQVALPDELEEHMSARGWKVPDDIDTRGLRPG